jgi:hypothetical protein
LLDDSDLGASIHGDMQTEAEASATLPAMSVVDELSDITSAPVDVESDGKQNDTQLMAELSRTAVGDGCGDNAPVTEEEEAVDESGTTGLAPATVEEVPIMLAPTSVKDEAKEQLATFGSGAVPAPAALKKPASHAFVSDLSSALTSEQPSMESALRETAEQAKVQVQVASLPVAGIAVASEPASEPFFTCPSCCAHLSKTHYSRNQWKTKDKPRCMKCVAKNSQVKEPGAQVAESTPSTAERKVNDPRPRQVPCLSTHLQSSAHTRSSSPTCSIKPANSTTLLAPLSPSSLQHQWSCRQNTYL